MNAALTCPSGGKAFRNFSRMRHLSHNLVLRHERVLPGWRLQGDEAVDWKNICRAKLQLSFSTVEQDLGSLHGHSKQYKICPKTLRADRHELQHSHQVSVLPVFTTWNSFMSASTFSPHSGSNSVKAFSLGSYESLNIQHSMHRAASYSANEIKWLRKRQPQTL